MTEWLNDVFSKDLDSWKRIQKKLKELNERKKEEAELKSKYVGALQSDQLYRLTG
jgi:hypothetical protein